VYERTFQTASKLGWQSLQGQPELFDVGPFTSLDPDALIEKTLRYLGQETRCSASGLLLVNSHRGQIMLYRSRPVDDLFLRAMQQRVVSIYCVSVGPAVVRPEIEAKVLGDAVPGPYEPPRSLLAVPMLCQGRVSGVVAIASVFPEAFDSRDLCTLSAVAAQASDALSGAS
jgi:GAF domain-containing protein